LNRVILRGKGERNTHSTSQDKGSRIKKKAKSEFTSWCGVQVCDKGGRFTGKAMTMGFARNGQRGDDVVLTRGKQRETRVVVATIGGTKFGEKKRERTNLWGPKGASQYSCKPVVEKEMKVNWG